MDMAKNELRYLGRVYTVLGEGTVHLAVSLLGDTLEPDTLDVVVEATGADAMALMAFALDDPVELVHRGERLLLCYIQSVTRTGPKTYRVYATSGVGLLIRRPHRGGIYTGQTVDQVLPGIFGNIPYRCKTGLGRRQLYGWLPYCKPQDSSARDNLASILYTIGGTVRADRNGALMIVPLWDGYSSALGRNKLANSAAAAMDGQVTGISVTEHQYLESEETVDLYEGATADGYEVVFDEPVHHLEATGFAILESGANYAILGAGYGTLVGHKYTHITLAVTRDLSPGRTENIVAVEDKYLVSPMASSAVADRLANYHSHKETISAPAVYLDELPGNRVYTAHPYDKVDLGACLTTADITLSVHLAAQMDMLAGYVPLADDDYYDMVELIDTATTWTAQADGEITVILIGGGGGGDGGGAGQDNARGSGTWRGAGGLGGLAGAAGKIYRTKLAVTAGQSFAVRPGAAGVGGAPGTKDGAEGAKGTPGEESTFGTLSSASGATSEVGWLDQTNGRTYGRPGTDGAKGGDGGKPGNAGEAVEWGSVTYRGGSVGGRDSSVGGGGGAAAGTDAYYDGFGWPAFPDEPPYTDGGKGGPGVSPAFAGADGANYGDAGSGGHGGGGGGQGGTGKISGYGGAGAAGSKGGDGKPGCVLLYYRKPKQTVSGWGVTSKRQWRLDKYGRRCIV
nr:MAG TPA: 43 kDa tail protein [Caudoviricetes sp.]